MSHAPEQHRISARIVYFLLAFGATVVQAAIPTGERTVLLNFYTSTGGATWTSSTNWNGPVGTECTWHGVTCDVAGTTVTGINLPGNNLTGSLPGDLNSLTNLAAFYAYNNHLAGPIPTLTGLTSLASFWVYNNQLTGSIPALTGLTNLAFFQINDNQLTGSIPALSGLSNLFYFWVHGNQLTGTIPALTGNVPSVPSPNALAAGGSSLCPNFLIHTQDPAWDVATGDTPWFFGCTGAPPPILLGTVSRHVHGGAGTFDLPLSLVPTNPTTEPRQGPAQTIVLTFDKPIVGASVGIAEGTATAAAPAFSGNDVVVNLTGIGNQQYVTIGLTTVASADGGVGGSGSVRVGFLVGDVNQSRVVTVADLGLVNARLSQVVTAANFLKDVNTSGTLTLTDKGITNANLTKALVAP